MTDIINDFVNIIIKDKKDNTYKFALARFLLDYINNTKETKDITINYKEIAESFLKYYWNQVVVYKIKQDFKTTKKTKLVSIIEDKTKNINELYEPFFKKEENNTLKKQLITQIYQYCLTDVIPRFQRDGKQNIYLHNSTPIKTKTKRLRYYQPIKEKRVIILKKEAIITIKKHYKILFKVVILEWAKFLEKTNFTPRLIQKVEKIDNPKRNSLLKYKKILLSVKKDQRCFYCDKKLDLNEIHVDHFIPWSYIFQDNIWNLVLSCSSCNLSKNNSLPTSEYLEKLKTRNKKEKELQVKEEIINNYYENCIKAGFITHSNQKI
jgi:5-methylcytosine-specific restriction endonuclease McrA